MKKIFVLVVLILIGEISYGQIDGNLLLGLTQATDTEMSEIMNPPLGSLIYNTTDFSIYQYSGSSWTRIFDEANNGSVATKINFGGHWTNTDVATDLNVNDVVAPIFGSESYKDDGNTLYEVSGNTLIVKADGRYDIRANLSFVNINGIRNNPTARIAIDGNKIGARAASGYMRNGSGHIQSSIHISEILELNANDVISLVMSRGGSTGIVRFNAADESSFIINKIQ